MKKEKDMENKNQITNRLVAVRGCGFKVYGSDGGLIGYKRDFAGEGFHYKDLDAIDKKAGVAYIPEYVLDHDYHDYDEEIIPPDLPNHVLWKFDDVKKEIAGAWRKQYKLTDAQLEFLTKLMLAKAEWASIATYNTDFFYDIEDAIEFDDTGLFTDLQKKAVSEGKTPQEYERKNSK